MCGSVPTVKIHIGTSGFAYKEWKGKFYPQKLPQRLFLAHYAESFDCVEINSTFYRMPKESVLLQWVQQVPDGFRFVLKMSNRITHRKVFDEEPDSTAYFIRTSSVLGGKLGPTLVQLPPYSQKDLARLRKFLDQFPPRWRVAMEFRHQSWFVAEVFEFLKERGVCLVHVDAEESKVDTKLVPTAAWGYLRLRGQDYSRDELKAWVGAVEAQGWEDAFVFFKHEDEALGPAMGQQFMELVT